MGRLTRLHVCPLFISSVIHKRPILAAQAEFQSALDRHDLNNHFLSRGLVCRKDEGVRISQNAVSFCEQTSKTSSAVAMLMHSLVKNLQDASPITKERR
jgi:hypothetical protein